MKRIYNAILLVLSAVLVALAPAALQAQSFDTSGTASLKGQYLFRYVNIFNDSSGDLVESCALTGAITFDGAGRYTLSNTQATDSLGAGKGDCTSLGGGTYGVQSNGIAQLDNPLYPITLFGSFSQPVLIASSTEDDGFDMFIAVQAPSASSSNGLLSGGYTVGMLDFPNANASRARQGYFTLNADGKGGIAAFTVTGSAENLQSGNTLTQNIAASTYSLSGASGGTVSFPGSSANSLTLVGGEKVLYVSADGNWLVGGTANGSDILFGFRAPSGTSSNSLVSGTYFTAGMEDNSPTTFNFLDAFYGSISANGSGTLISHQRFDDVVSVNTYDNTFSKPVTIGADGTYYDGSVYTYLTGANGSGLMLIGSNQQFSLIIGVHAPSYKSTGAVWLDPIGITDAANYTPITNGFAPGELVSLYGTFGMSTHVASSLPLSDTLDGGQVFVNGEAAPVYLVSGNQVSAFIPYDTVGQPFATFQVEVNGTKSNAVTVYLANSAPGVYTLAQNGTGAGAILHSNYTVVNSSSPAAPGETVSMFLTGLGPVTPQVASGAAAPSSPLSNSVEASSVSVFLTDGTNFIPAAVSFAGLAPGFAGLYQINFALPKSGLANGDVSIDVGTVEAFNEMATIKVAGFSQITGLAVPNPRTPQRPRSRTVAAGKRERPANPRRALPERRADSY